MSTLRCYDSVTADAIPAAPVVLGYVDGDYRTYDALETRFRDSSTKVISSTVAGDVESIMADCEEGNMLPPEVATWTIKKLHRNERPTIYGSVDYLMACRSQLLSLRIHPSLVDWFLADYRQVAPEFRDVDWFRRLPRGYVGWQFANSISLNGHTIDASIVSMKWARHHGWTGRRLTTPLKLKACS